MKYIEVTTDTGNSDTVIAIAAKLEAADFRAGSIDIDGMQSMRLLVSYDKIQSALDSLPNLFGTSPTTRIVVLPVEIALTKHSAEESKEENATTTAREAHYQGVEKNARMDRNFLILVFLSTTVAAIGLIENNVAVVIGAMVIPPLLGPNLAFGLGTALGDIDLMRKSAITTSIRIIFATALSMMISFFWLIDISSPELMAGTNVGMDSVALALASGAAAALSLTTGLSSVLVGVMVAVA